MTMITHCLHPKDYFPMFKLLNLSVFNVDETTNTCLTTLAVFVKI